MKHVLIAFLLISLGGTCFGSQQYGNLIIKSKDILRVYDGDTFFVDIPGYPDIIGKNIGIRVLNIDTPEIRGDCPEEKELAYKARDYLVDALANAKHIELRNISRDKYFRIDGELYLDGVSIIELMVMNGLAKAYDGGTKESWCTL